MRDELKLALVEFSSIDERLKNLGNWNSIHGILNNINAITECVYDAVYLVEVVTSDEVVSNEDKLRDAVDILDDYFKLPWYMEWFDGQVFKILISSSVTSINGATKREWNLEEARKYISTTGNSFFKFLFHYDPTIE